MATLLVARQEEVYPGNLTRTEWLEQCTLDSCPLEESGWGYRPSLPANALFLALFAVSMVIYLAQVLMTRRFIGFAIAMVCGCILEVIGYAGRIMAYIEPFDENGFLIQICCLTVGPAFFAAGIYLCLSRIITVFGVENSRIAPQMYPRIFIACDLISLILQGAGGGLASVANNNNEDTGPGTNTMIAGLAFQVATMLVYIILAVDFGFRTWRRTRQLGQDQALDPKHAQLRDSWKFKGFLTALSLATLLIFLRCVYRVAELSEGWEGDLIQTQSYFIVLESATVVIAVLLLNAFNPAFCFSEGYEDGRTSFFGRSKKGSMDVEK